MSVLGVLIEQSLYKQSGRTLEKKLLKLQMTNTRRLIDEQSAVLLRRFILMFWGKFTKFGFTVEVHSIFRLHVSVKFSKSALNFAILLLKGPGV